MTVPRSGAVLIVWTEKAIEDDTRDYYLADRYDNTNQFAAAYANAAKHLKKLQADERVLIASIAVVTESTDY